MPAIPAALCKRRRSNKRTEKQVHTVPGTAGWTQHTHTRVMCTSSAEFPEKQERDVGRPVASPPPGCCMRGLVAASPPAAIATTAADVHSQRGPHICCTSSRVWLQLPVRSTAPCRRSPDTRHRRSPSRQRCTQQPAIRERPPHPPVQSECFRWPSATAIVTAHAVISPGGNASAASTSQRLSGLDRAMTASPASHVSQSVATRRARKTATPRTRWSCHQSP
jgi:hypothetical protein